MKTQYGYGYFDPYSHSWEVVDLAGDNRHEPVVMLEKHDDGCAGWFKLDDIAGVWQVVKSFESPVVTEVRARLENNGCRLAGHQLTSHGVIFQVEVTRPVRMIRAINLSLQELGLNLNAISRDQLRVTFAGQDVKAIYRLDELRGLVSKVDNGAE